MLTLKTALVTGASSGIGRALALKLARAGVRLHLLGRDRERLEAVASEAAQAAGYATVHAFDLLDDAALLRVAGTVTEPLDALIHSAGVVMLGALEDADVTDLDWQYRVNVRAPYLLTQALLPHLKRAEGQVVFVNSGAGLSARAGWGQYTASKHALRALAESLREEVAPSGVRVMSVFPGRTDSPMQERVKKLENEPYDASAFLRPEDVALQVVAALSLGPGASVTDLVIRPAGR